MITCATFDTGNENYSEIHVYLVTDRTDRDKQKTSYRYVV